MTGDLYSPVRGNEKDAWDKWTVEKTTTLDSKQMIEILHDDIKGESKIIDL